jgi:hypothetical protein
VLSHPLVVEAAETLFVPVAIRNNVGGYEKDVRERYEEPAWNNPVVRFLDSDGKDVIPRKAGVWGTGAMLARMTRVLRQAERPVPTWLELVTSETSADERAGDVDTAAFAMT